MRNILECRTKTLRTAQGDGSDAQDPKTECVTLWKAMRLIWTILLALSATGFAAHTSVYTSLEARDCRTLTRDPQGWVEDLCPGVGGLRLLVQEGDPRQNIVVLRGQTRTSLNLWSVVGSSFSTVGPRAEWRLKDGVPVALIVRYNLSDPEAADRITSYLAVARLGGKPCVVANIPPGPQQNILARRAADGAGGRDCLKAP